MKLIRFALLVALTCTFFATQAVRADTAHTSQISRLGLATTQWLTVVLETHVDVTGHPCATDTDQISWDKTTEHGKQMMMVAMAGYLAGKKLFFHYSDTECGLWGNQAIVTRVDVFD